MALSAHIAGRIERLRQHFELADNWPTEPFALNAFSWVSDAAEFVDGHLTFLLSTESNALALPYLERLESILPPKAVAPPEAKRAEPPPEEKASEQDLEEGAHGGEGRQLAFF